MSGAPASAVVRRTVGRVLTAAVAVLTVVSAFAAVDVAELAPRGAVASADVGLPSWWNGRVCDTGRYAGSRPLGASYLGVQACGPRPLYDSPFDDVATVTFPGGWGEYEWECVELAMRFMYQIYGVKAYGANGNTVVSHYDATVDGGGLVKVDNGVAGQAPQPGDIISFNYGDFGHVAVVTASSVDGNGNGSITTINQNTRSADGWATITVSAWRVQNWGSEVPYGWLHDPAGRGNPGGGGNPGPPPRIGAITGDGSALVKEGGLDASWVDEYDGVRQVVLSGNRIGVITTSGSALVKEGGLSAPWVDEYDGVKQLTLSGTRIGVMTTSGSALVKDGGLSAAWVDEYDGARQLALSGTRIGVITASGSALVKDGDLSAAWVDEYDGARHVVLSGTRIGVVTAKATALVKDGGLSASWVDEYDGVRQLALSGSRIGVIAGYGSALVKDGGLSAAWSDEYDGARHLELSGDRISVLTAASSLTKAGSLDAGWSDELDAATSTCLPDGLCADLDAPRPALASMPAVQLAGSRRVSWGARDDDAGVASYDVRWRVATATTAFDTWHHPASLQATAATSTTVALRPGRDYCFSVRARDHASNVSRWSRQRCVTRAIDDRSLSASTGWSRGTGDRYYLGTITRTREAHKSLSKRQVTFRRVGVVATTCAACGRLAVYLGTTRLGTLSLRSSSEHDRRLLLLPLGRLRTGKLRFVTLVAGARVRIDGAVISRT